MRRQKGTETRTVTLGQDKRSSKIEKTGRTIDPRGHLIAIIDIGRDMYRLLINSFEIKVLLSPS